MVNFQIFSNLIFGGIFQFGPLVQHMPAAAAAFLQVTRCFFSFCLWVERIGTILNAKNSENVISRQFKTMSVEFNHTAFIGQRDFDQEVSDNDFEVSLKVFVLFANIAISSILAIYAHYQLRTEVPPKIQRSIWELILMHLPSTKMLAQYWV